ncbi:ATPase [Planctomycetales bacterium]|nr:ATPase [Planctomycetales bacterium]GHT31784.1 ATPase [Planctomycetales bacterium]GHT36779.1 ATPase [Planctomycetales bacterium]
MSSAEPPPEQNPFDIHLAHLLRARYAAIYVQTYEEGRFLQRLTSIVRNEHLIRKTRKIYTWSQTDGIAAEDELPRGNSLDPLDAINSIRKIKEPAVIVFKDLHLFLRTSASPQSYNIIRKLRDILPEIKTGEHAKNVIILAPSLILPDELRTEVTTIDFPLPTMQELEKNLDQFIADNEGGNIAIDLPPETKERIIKAALGLTLSEAENAFARAAVEGNSLDASDVKLILDEKCQIIKKTGVLEYINTDLKIDDVGGLDNLKRWLAKRNKSWLEDAKEYSLPSPKGILLTGVPGCGKSLTAKVISSYWQLPLLRMDIGKLFGGLVGSSEQNMRTAIQTAEAIAPSLLWVDEIEKGFSGIGSSGDSGTATRMFGTFLTWIQEKEKPVFVIATANNIQNLPPELLRKGRFDEIFFVDLPTLDERYEIFIVHLKKRIKTKKVQGDTKFTKSFVMDLAERTEGFIGSELEQVVITALFEAFSQERPIQREDFIKAINTTVPLSITLSEQIVALRRWANTRAVAATSRESLDGYAGESDTGKDIEDGGQNIPSDISTVRGGRRLEL